MTIHKQLKSLFNLSGYIFLIEISVKIPKQTTPEVNAMLKLIIGEKILTKNNKIPDTNKNNPRDIQRFIKLIGLTLLASKTLPTAPQKNRKLSNKIRYALQESHQ